ncbi:MULTISPECIES: glycosyltransferase [unclassified Streptomyces]|uniref:glycosyltransferase n=1 Tax=unclassified Streptomyces TaxID=2593676 RepID=UPI0023659607|nr:MULTISPECIES: glycosyltransferase [unclassified Streptomyces]MDF3142278.1 glycosyltransferase [Streptomyces sp. T21Q-yed]WDF37857.1 glycosyltransferase [Streptomyces sp. T12]
MRVLIVTSGTTGDVAPFTGVGCQLREAGHQVTVATHEDYRALISECGLGFRPLPGDPQALIPTHGAGLPRRSDGLRGSVAAARAYVPALTQMADATLEAAREGTDVMVLSSPTAVLGLAVADGLRIPALLALLQPHTPTRSFAPVGLGRHSLGRTGNLLAGRAQVTLMRLAAGPNVQRLRAEMGLSPLTSGQRRRMGDSRPVAYGFSPLVIARPPEWPSHVAITGYWWPATPRTWQPDRTLKDFLSAGPPPVFIGFGSMIPGQREQMSQLAVEALRKAGTRGVVQSGWAGVAAHSDDVLTVGQVAHEWLFPRTAAVVHHAGAGTTAAGLRAGVPAVPTPVYGDQSFWSARLRALGVSPRAVPFSRLTSDTLADAIRAAVHNPVYRRRARLIAGGIAAEDGTGGFVRYLDQFVPGTTTGSMW